jgi:lipopolysaccharide O-acetyltransferase
MASGIFISDHSHGSYSGSDASSPLIPPNERPLVSKEVFIDDDCWLGEKVAVLPGVTVGKGSIIGAGSVVTSDIPPYTIAVGIPARPVKKYDFESKQWIKCP